jgi:hypothetical protein
MGDEPFLNFNSCWESTVFSIISYICDTASLESFNQNPSLNLNTSEPPSKEKLSTFISAVKEAIVQDIELACPGIEQGLYEADTENKADQVPLREFQRTHRIIRFLNICSMIVREKLSSHKTTTKEVSY